jgi:hypothetical protein
LIAKPLAKAAVGVAVAVVAFAVVEVEVVVAVGGVVAGAESASVNVSVIVFFCEMVEMPVVTGKSFQISFCDAAASSLFPWMRQTMLTSMCWNWWTKSDVRRKYLKRQ